MCRLRCTPSNRSRRCWWPTDWPASNVGSSPRNPTPPRTANAPSCWRRRRPPWRLRRGCGACPGPSGRRPRPRPTRRRRRARRWATTAGASRRTRARRCVATRSGAGRVARVCGVVSGTHFYVHVQAPSRVKQLEAIEQALAGVGAGVGEKLDGVPNEEGPVGARGRAARAGGGGDGHGREGVLRRLRHAGNGGGGRGRGVAGRRQGAGRAAASRRVLVGRSSRRPSRPAGTTRRATTTRTTWRRGPWSSSATRPTART